MFWALACGSLAWSSCLPGPPMGFEMFASFWSLMNMLHCSSKNIGPMYVEVSGRSARNVPGGLNLLWFRPSLDCGFLQAQLIQNLWNLLELNKICMEHSARAQFIPTFKTWNNGRQHLLKLEGSHYQPRQRVSMSREQSLLLLLK